MASARIIVKRRKTVRNIRKITRTMQLIATARFQAALARATAAKPYTERLAQLVSDLSSVTENVTHPLMRPAADVKKSVMVVITSNRGLCGGYNSNVLRTSVSHLKNAEAEGIATDIHMVGKKGCNYFKFLGREFLETLPDITDKPRFDQIEPLGNELMGRFINGEIASVHVCYMQFVTAGKQTATVTQLLPLQQDVAEGAEESTHNTQYDFSPNPEELLAELLPATVRIRLFQCFTEAIASEQIARMVAMKAATEAAGDMITTLTRQYNRARQTAITMELLDIVGGANALE
jgi:F-type H+-transporting ATPase subunit gamma